MATGKLIVLAAFDRDDEGNLVPAFEPREMQSEDKAKLEAMGLAPRHAGVVAWVRSADLALGDFGDPVILFQAGDIPAME